MKHNKPCNCDSCKENAKDPQYQVCPRCHLTQVTNSKIHGPGYCINCMRVTIQDDFIEI